MEVQPSYLVFLAPASQINNPDRYLATLDSLRSEKSECHSQISFFQQRRSRSFHSKSANLLHEAPSKKISHSENGSSSSSEPEFQDPIASQILNLKTDLNEWLVAYSGGKRRALDFSLHRIKDYLQKELFTFKPMSALLEDPNSRWSDEAVNNPTSCGNIANWDELNQGILLNKIDCAVCFNTIFYHESLEALGPFAYQCTFCTSGLFCRVCVKMLSRCPLCKEEDTIEVANALLVAEIKKIKYRCSFNRKKDPKNVCNFREGMSARDLFRHFAKECPGPRRVTKLTLKSRDLQYCRFFCNLESQPSRPISKLLPLMRVPDQHSKFSCTDCEGNSHPVGSLMRRQCERHLKNQTFPARAVTLQDSAKPSLLDNLKCYLCGELPVIPRMCQHCKICILCLPCTRQVFIRSDQCPECSVEAPSFDEPPRNFRVYYQQIMVQCEKCIDRFLMNEILSVTMHFKTATFRENLNQSCDKLISIQDIDLEDRDHRQLVPIPELKEPGEESNKESFYSSQLLQQIWERKALLKDWALERVKNNVRSMPYCEYLSHLETCDSCNDCSYYCSKCRENIKIGSKEPHTALDTLSKDLGEQVKSEPSPLAIGLAAHNNQDDSRSSLSSVNLEALGFEGVRVEPRLDYRTKVYYWSHYLFRNSEYPFELLPEQLNTRGFAILLLELMMFNVIHVLAFLIIRSGFETSSDEDQNELQEYGKEMFKRAYSVIMGLYMLILLWIELVQSAELEEKRSMKFILFVVLQTISAEWLFFILTGGAYLTFMNLEINQSKEIVQNIDVIRYSSMFMKILYYLALLGCSFLIFKISTIYEEGMGFLKGGFLWTLAAMGVAQIVLTALTVCEKQ